MYKMTLKIMPGFMTKGTEITPIAREVEELDGRMLQFNFSVSDL